jgi:hypothetical protein
MDRVPPEVALAEEVAELLGRGRSYRRFGG